MPCKRGRLNQKHTQLNQLQSLSEGSSIICVKILSLDPVVAEDSTGSISLDQGSSDCITDCDTYLLLVKTSEGRHSIERGHSVPGDLISLHHHLSTEKC